MFSVAHADVILEDPFFEATVNVVIFVNFFFVGLEVENGDSVMFDVLRHTLCGFYAGEVLWRALGHGIRDWGVVAEMAIALVVLVGAWALPDHPLLWRLSVLRLPRFLRISRFAHTAGPLLDLWLVVMGIARSAKALVWAMVLLLLFVLWAGLTTRGYMTSDGDRWWRGHCPDATGARIHNFREEMNCLEVSEYFGTLGRACFTALQVATLDRWASKITRPLLDISTASSFFLVCFVVVTNFFLLSLASGVLVWSTVELARVHEDHHTRVQGLKDKESINTLRDYFRESLKREDKPLLDFRELRDSSDVPHVKQAWTDLDLPVNDVTDLWAHLDVNTAGGITLDEFQAGCLRLKKPATRFDMSCMAARVNRCVAYGAQVSGRCDVLAGELEHLHAKLSGAFAEMKELSDVKELERRNLPVTLQPWKRTTKS